MVSSIANEGNPLLASALHYAARGWLVIPLHNIRDGKCSCQKGKGCGSPGKHPRSTHGLKDGSTDPKQIRSWWQKWPDANVGVCTGPESGIWMLGPDGDEGVAELSAMARKYAPLPRTPRAKTGSGGRHHIFRWPADGNISNRQNHRAGAIDVRGAGGYFVADPSVNGNGPYRWEISPDECEVADAPAWVVAWVRSDGKKSGSEYSESAPLSSAGRESSATGSFKIYASNGVSIEDRAIAYLAKMPSAIAGQWGHNQTMEAARVVVYGFDLGVDVGFRVLWTHYNPRCLPPWSEKELRHKCDDADTKPFSKPRGWLLQELNGYHATSSHDLGASFSNANGEETPVEAPASFHLTDSGNASRMIAGHGEGLRHCFPWKKWTVWDGSRWRTDATAEATRAVKRTVARMFAEAAAEVAALQSDEDHQTGKDE
jgi:hypothetical protein